MHCLLACHISMQFFQLNLVEDEVDGEELTLTKSLKVNVLGQPRKNPVPLPTGIKGGRPGAIPNIKVGWPGQINTCHR